MKREWAIDPSELSVEQKKIIQLPIDGHYAIIGPPGSGKTNVLLLRTSYLMRAKKTCRIKALVFTSALKSFIRKGMREYGLESSTVETFHGWGYSILAAAGVKVNRSEDFDKVAPIMKKLIRENKIEKLDFLLIDEAQDFNKEIIELFFLIADNVYLFFDRDQSIHRSDDNVEGNYPPNIRPFKDKFGDPYTLNENYRVPAPIAKLANAIKPLSNLINRTVNKSGDAPIYNTFITRNEEWTYLKNKIEELPDENPDYNFVILQKTSNKEIGAIFSEMRDFGLKTECPVFNVGGYCDFDNLEPKLITYTSVKGLEFDVVFAAGASAFSNKDKNLAFVAVTRAKKQLHITGQNRISDLFLPPNEEDTPNSLPTLDDLFI